jgi:hypothetical protein
MSGSLLHGLLATMTGEAFGAQAFFDHDDSTII